MTKKVAKIVLPIMIGALGGYFYYYFIGCNNGCAITGSPTNSTAYGAVIGALFTNWKSGIKSLRNNREKNVERREIPPFGKKEHGND
ncbi:MAG: hypothetical protein DRQ01_01925 [Ignavibacteriae bacterium]|nr:MAG: hypothetical protein DRQ01_01925 [Ignavibacteriota bacterium]